MYLNHLKLCSHGLKLRTVGNCTWFWLIFQGLQKGHLKESGKGSQRKEVGQEACVSE